MEEEATEGAKRIIERLGHISFEEWSDLHNPEKCNALTVTRLVEYMGLGYDTPYRVLKKKQHTDYVKSLLEYGRNMEEIAARVIPLFHDQYGFQHYDIPKKNEIWLSMLGTTPLTDRYRRSLYPVSEEKDAGKPLYGSPDMIATNADDELHVIEIKCPRESLCLAGIITDEQMVKFYEKKAYINSEDRRIQKKLMGHILQAAIYAWILSHGTDAKVAEECTLMYFYPDVASNTYIIIAYDIDWEMLFDPEFGWDLESIIQEYYERFIPLSKQKNDKLLRKFRRGIHPLLGDDLSTKSLFFSKGMLRTRMLKAGGESTKEITSYALDQFLPEQVEQTSLEC